MSGWPTGPQPPRTDLPWLRHRSRRATARTPALAPTPPSSSSGLDLSAPAVKHDKPPAAVPVGDLLDLSPAPAPAVKHDKPPASFAPAGRRAAPTRSVPRLVPGGRLILTPADPTVTLTRVQSGIGALTVEAVVSAAVGNVRLGAAWQLTDGATGIVQPVSGLLTAPVGARRPVLRATAERLTVDLRQSRSLARLLVYGFADSGRELDWGGTLVLTTFGGARLEVPMDVGRSAGPVALLSLYAIDGELVLRAERDVVGGAVRDVARAYGYDRISWADDRTPVP